MAESQYAKVIPLYRDLDRSRAVRETEDERLMKLRYPPSGDPLVWVHHGPDGQRSRERDRHAQAIADHRHHAAEPGADCGACGFPWWPEAGA